MKRYLHLTAISLMALLWCACSNENKPLSEAEHEITVVSESYFEVGYEEVILDVEVEANCSWLVSKTDSNGDAVSWIKTDLAGGKGNKAFRIKVLKNNTADQRSGTVNIYSDQVTAYIDIQQAANPDPSEEPEVFKGYSMPVYQMFESSLGVDVAGGTIQELDCAFSNAIVDGNVIRFENGLVIEKTGETPADMKMLCPSHTKPEDHAGFQLGVAASFGSGESWIYKIPMNFELYGDFRFTYGSRKEGISSAEPYKWSSDKGVTWNEITKMEALKSDAAFKSIWFTIPESQKVPREGQLWIKVGQTAAKVYIQNGIALERAKASSSGIASEDNTAVIISEGFDATVEANASYVTVPGFMKSAVSGYTASDGTDTDPFVSTNSAVSTTHCFARPGFLQVGYSDEALKARCGWNGEVVLKVGDRLKEMGITEPTPIKISFKAAGMTNAFGVINDAKIVIKSGAEVVASVSGLVSDKFGDYSLRIPSADQSTVLTLTSEKSATKADSGEASSSYESADYRFFIDDLLVEVAPAMADMVLTFDFSDPAKMASWPTDATRKGYTAGVPVKCVYNLDGTDYTFILADPQNASLNLPYFNVNRLSINTQRYFGLPVIDGYKLVKVSFVAQVKGTGCAISSDIASGTADPTFVEGGEKADVTSFELKSTEAGGQYYLKVWGGYGITELTLTYTAE